MWSLFYRNDPLWQGLISSGTLGTQGSQHKFVSVVEWTVPWGVTHRHCLCFLDDAKHKRDKLVNSGCDPGLGSVHRVVVASGYCSGDNVLCTGTTWWPLPSKERLRQSRGNLSFPTRTIGVHVRWSLNDSSLGSRRWMWWGFVRGSRSSWFIV